MAALEFEWLRMSHVEQAGMRGSAAARCCPIFPSPLSGYTFLPRLKARAVIHGSPLIILRRALSHGGKGDNYSIGRMAD